MRTSTILARARSLAYDAHARVRHVRSGNETNTRVDHGASVRLGWAGPDPNLRS